MAFRVRNLKVIHLNQVLGFAKSQVPDRIEQGLDKLD